MAVESCQEIHFKIVYYGPASSGKSTNLRFIWSNVPELSRGDLSSTDIDGGAAHVEFLPVDMGVLFGHRVRFHLYSVPSAPGYEAERASILSGADGIVFVADSQRDRFRDDLVCLREMEEIARGFGLDPAQMPLVLQYNKRDLPEAVPVNILDTRLNTSGKVRVEAASATGVGVLATLRAVSKLVAEKLR